MVDPLVLPSSALGRNLRAGCAGGCVFVFRAAHVGDVEDGFAGCVLGFVADTCIFEVRSGGKTWKKYRVPIVAQALKTAGVQEMQTRKVRLTGSGQVRDKSLRMLTKAIPALNSSPASYAYWIDSKDATIKAATSRQHTELAATLRNLGLVKGMRTITVRNPWASSFEPNPNEYILIAWKPASR